MAKESTAVANLLELMAQRPIERESGDDLLFVMPAAEAAPKRQKKVRRVSDLVPKPKPPDQTAALTHRIARYDARRPLLVGAIVLGSVAIGLSIYKIARSGHAGSIAASVAMAKPPPKPIVVEPLAPAPPPAPAPAPLPIAPPPKPALVDVTFDSRPAGATVTVGGSVAGTTPISLAIDPAKEVDATFALDGQAPKTVHVDPHTMKHVTVELAVVEPDPVPAPAPAARAAAPHRHAAGSGTLMISTKPPCDIAIDGASTGLIAPQRSIKLAAGHHTLTLTNRQQHVKKTVGVDIAANQATRVIKDFMK